MDDKKIIIRNCPAITTGWNDKDYICNTHQMGCEHCQDCTDCLLKRIVEECKGIECPCEYEGADCWECTESGARRFADRILKLLNIQEVE